MEAVKRKTSLAGDGMMLLAGKRKRLSSKAVRSLKLYT